MAVSRLPVREHATACGELRVCMTGWMLIRTIIIHTYMCPTALTCEQFYRHIISLFCCLVHACINCDNLLFFCAFRFMYSYYLYTHLCVFPPTRTHTLNFRSTFVSAGKKPVHGGHHQVLPHTHAVKSATSFGSVQGQYYYSVYVSLGCRLIPT